VRHGQTDANAAGLLQGRVDRPLNQRGKGQARDAAVALRPIVAAGARIVSSPLARARQTAAAMLVCAGRREDEMVTDHSWVELDYGSWDQVPLREVPPEQWQKWRADLSFAPPLGESLAVLGERVRTACRDLLDDCARSDVVVISHVSPIKAAVAWALGVTDDASWRMQLDPASICRISVSDRGPALRTFNETGHLH
jgi:broad specificity phosphatase PhoE